MSTTVSGGVAFDDSNSQPHPGQTDIDTDGIGPTSTGRGSSDTSFHNGGHALDGDATSFIALSPVWAGNHSIQMGDIAALTYKGKTTYAVYGDNWASVDAVHAEISVRAAKALAGGDGTNSLNGVHFAVYPGTHTQLGSSFDQAKIDQIGAQASGGASPSSTPPTTGSCCTGSTVSFGAGSLPSSVPAPYNSIFTAAANKFQIAPALLAAIFYGGEHGNSFPDPPPPYGHGGPWASSSAGAQGPFQFIPSTWSGYQQDGNGDGKKDVQDLADAAFGAADYLAASGAKNSTKTADLQRAIFAYNHAQFYVNDVMAAYQKFSGGPAPSPSPSTPSPPSTGCPSSSGTVAGFTNPFPGGWIPNRLDMGYDGNFKGQIVAPFSGTITYASDSWSNWGGYLEIKADKQPAGLPTSTLYFAEGVAPILSLQGKDVPAGTPIANPADSPYGDSYNHGANGAIEWGMAKDGPPWPSDTYVYGQCGSSAAKSAVLTFAQWAKSTLGLPDPSETGNAGCP